MVIDQLNVKGIIEHCKVIIVTCQFFETEIGPGVVKPRIVWTW